MWRIGVLILVLLASAAGVVGYGFRSGILVLEPKSKIRAQNIVWDSYRSSVDRKAYPFTLPMFEGNEVFLKSAEASTKPFMWKASKPKCEDWAENRYRCRICEFRVWEDEQIGIVGDAFEVLAFVSKEEEASGVMKLTIRVNEAVSYIAEDANEVVRETALDATTTFNTWCFAQGYGDLETLADSIDTMRRRT